MAGTNNAVAIPQEKATTAVSSSCTVFSLDCQLLLFVLGEGLGEDWGEVLEKAGGTSFLAGATTLFSRAGGLIGVV